METFYSIRAAARRMGINHQTANNRISELETRKLAVFPRRKNLSGEEVIVPESMLGLLRQKPPKEASVDIELDI